MINVCANKLSLNIEKWVAILQTWKYVINKLMKNRIIIIYLGYTLVDIQNYWNSVLLEFECPSTKLDAKMRKILIRL
jgi:hypothetical protein